MIHMTLIKTDNMPAQATARIYGLQLHKEFVKCYQFSRECNDSKQSAHAVPIFSTKCMNETKFFFFAKRMKTLAAQTIKGHAYNPKYSENM
jgi:hypothetical protein